MALVIISGTPCTGKSALARILKKKLGFYHLNLHCYYPKISSGYSQSKQCYSINLKKLEILIGQKLKQHPYLIVDSHITHLLPKKLVALAIITQCSDLKELKRRLQKRRYSRQKVEENLQAEIFQVCLQEARQNKHQIITVDTARKISCSALIRKIRSALKQTV